MNYARIAAPNLDEEFEMYDGGPLDYDFHYNDEETDSLNGLLNFSANVGADDLRRVALWKLDRVLRISDDTIAILQQLAQAEHLSIDDPLSTQALESLVACPGIWYPMASAILKFVRPDIFPIIDVRAVRALTDRAPRRHDYNTEMYIDYVRDVMDIAAAQELELWQVDQQLYCYDIEYNGNI